MVVGDSKVNIEWINDRSNLNLIYLHGWKEQIRCLKAIFEEIKFMHIHREFNTVTDLLSKKTLDNLLGLFFYEEIFKEIVVNTERFFIF
jgi:hypothetical protein